MITLTLDRIFECQTERRGWTNATLEALGLYRHEKTTGWPRRIVGKQLTEEDWQRALAGRFKFVPRKNGKPRKVRAEQELGAAPDQGTPAPGGW